MQQMQVKPMGVGRILDRSFQLYRKHFVKLTLIVLLLFGPYYLIQNLILVNQSTLGTSMLIDEYRAGSSFEDILDSMAALGETNPFGSNIQAVLYVLILLPVFFLGLMPMGVASIVYLVKASLQGEAIPTVGQLLKSSLKRFWPMAGNTALMGMIISGLYMAFVIFLIIGMLIFIFGLGITEGFNGGGMSPGLIVVSVILGIALLVGSIIGLLYFLFRWGYYLPLVVLKEETIGFGRSWKLTRRSFWRLLLLYVVLSIVLSIISGILSLVITFIVGAGLFSQLLQALISVLIAPLWILPYVLSFFDLRIRNEGLGLESMIQTTVYGGASMEQPIQEHPTLEQFRQAQQPIDAEAYDKTEEPDKKDE
jgi:hypothetical protein